MPPDTRQALIDTATRHFAEIGIDKASLLEINRAAGQRNRGAVHYHFGSREALLAAVLEQQVDFFAPREKEMLERALQRPGDLSAAVLAAIRPVVELAGTGWRGRCFLMIVAQLIDRWPYSSRTEAVMSGTGGHEVWELVRDRMPEVPENVTRERLALFTAFLLRSTADRSRHFDDGPLEARVSDEEFVDNLLAMSVGMLAAAPIRADTVIPM